MNEHEITHLLRLGALSKMPETDRVKVQKAAQEIREIVASNGDHGIVALSLVGAEKAAEEA